MNQRADVNVYLVLLQGSQVLLLLRENTGYEDGKWCLVAGHAEEGESVFVAMSREAMEEAGIIIDPKDLAICHIMHRKTERENIDVFMTCAHWKGSIVNCEPHKCGGLSFFDVNEMPLQTIDCVKQAILQGLKGLSFSEYGYDIEHNNALQNL